MSKGNSNFILTDEEKRKEYAEDLKNFRPLDDVFMRILFKNNIPLTQFVVRTITEKSDLIVEYEETQYDMKRLLGARSVCLDVLASDSEGRKYNIELQKSGKGADVKRARYHSSAMDVEFLNARQEFDELPETYVIFFTEHDVFKRGKPIYKIERTFTDSGKLFDDGEHIIYVNCAYQNKDDHSDLAKLIHDFKCSNPNDMYIDLLAQNAGNIKSTNGGNTMALGNMYNFILIEKRESAFRLLKMGELSIEKISQALDLPLEEVERINREYCSSPETKTENISE